jgi:FKBP-type peptidyl-prolyl cis-trans isomerase
MLQRVTLLIALGLTPAFSAWAQTKTITPKPIVVPKGNAAPIKTIPVKPAPAPQPVPAAAPKALPPMKRLNDKMEYAFIQDKKVGTTPKEGDLIRVHMISASKGRMMYNSYMNNKGKPVEFNVNKPTFKGDVINLIMLMTPGDSAVCAADAADIFAGMKKPLPDFIKKGDKMEYYVRLISFKPAAEIQKEQQAKMQKQMQEQMAKQQKEREKQNAADDKKLNDYFKKNGLQPTKLPSGVYYTITKPGEGKNAMKNGKAKLQWTGKLLNGKTFDWSKDSTGNPKPPFEFNIGGRGLNAGVDEVMALLNKGSQATVYVPSSMGFGKYKQPAKPGFKEGVPENSILQYDIEVVDLQEPVDEDAELQKLFAKQGLTNVTKTASGMYYMITNPGSGDSPQTGDKMVMNYTGALIDGTKFDSNVDSAFNHVQPFEFELGKGQVIKGWDEGVALLKKGAKATFFIPSALGYGARGQAKIPAFSTLIFDVELVDFKKQTK